MCCSIVANQASPKPSQHLELEASRQVHSRYDLESLF